jgi:hypothetical protein
MLDCLWGRSWIANEIRSHAGLPLWERSVIAIATASRSHQPPPTLWERSVIAIATASRSHNLAAAHLIPPLCAAG